jgi:hypothetical protein
MRRVAVCAFAGFTLTLALGQAQQAQARVITLEGQRFDDVITLNDRVLRLNGLGLRGVAWVKAFVAGLYVPVPSSEPGALLAMPGPKRLRLKVMLDAPSHELTKSLVARINKYEPEPALKQLGERPAQLGELIDSLGDLRSGDVLDLDFEPGKGVRLSYNDKAVGAPVAGEDLYRAVLKIFVGERAIDKRMKAGLLRGGY